MAGNRKLRVAGYIVLACITLCLAAYFEFFLEYAYFARSSILSGFVAASPQTIHFIRLAIMWVGAAVIGWLIWRFHSPILHIAYRYRYLIALIILVACVLLEISGSSIACLGRQIGSNNTGTLFGIPRLIRSDEYATITPLTFSQYYNHSGQFPYFSETIRGATTDTFISYGLPSWNICTVFRPFLWGYLLLEPAKGLSFFWVARLLALWLVCFEFAMVYTNKSKWLSLAAAMLISLAPTVQWWYAVCGLVEMLIFSQGALLCVYHYMHTEKTLRKLVFAGIFLWCLGGYIYAFYPAWQISIGFVFITLLVYIILENKKGASFRWKREIPIIAAVLVIFAASVVYILSKSGDTISAIMNTVYPGSRSDTGGNGFLGLFKYGASMFFPLTSQGLNTNTCEASAFFDLFPMGILLAIYVLFIEKKRDRMLILILIIQTVLLVYVIIGFPAFLAKITQLKYSPTNRALLALGLSNILLLIRSMSVSEKKPKTAVILVLSLALSIGVSLLCRQATGDYIGIFFEVAVVAVLFTGFMLTFAARSNGWRKLFALFCTLVVILSGGLVNPVQRGVDMIYKNELVQTIQSVSEKDNGLWIVESGYPITNIPILVGAPTINSTNVYPDLERWHNLDPERKYEDVYNRYAQIAVELSEDKTRFGLIQADSFLLTLNYEDLKKLEVKYILTAKNYDSFPNDLDMKFDFINKTNGFNIYEIRYE